MRRFKVLEKHVKEYLSLKYQTGDLNIRNIDHDVIVEGIKNFSEESIFNYYNNFHDSSTGDFRQHCTFNPLDKVVELYERLLASEREKNELLKNK